MLGGAPPHAGAHVGGGQGFDPSSACGAFQSSANACGHYPSCGTLEGGSNALQQQLQGQLHQLQMLQQQMTQMQQMQQLQQMNHAADGGADGQAQQLLGAHDGGAEHAAAAQASALLLAHAQQQAQHGMGAPPALDVQSLLADPAKSRMLLDQYSAMLGPSLSATLVRAAPRRTAAPRCPRRVRATSHRSHAAPLTRRPRVARAVRRAWAG